MEFLLYIDFRGDELRPFFTFVGGVKTTSFVSNKIPVETADFTKDYRFLVQGSGVQEVSITLSGILENYDKQFRALFKAHEDGRALKVRLTNGDEGITLRGSFIIENISGESSANVENSFTMSLLSSGEVTSA